MASLMYRALMYHCIDGDLIPLPPSLVGISLVARAAKAKCQPDLETSGLALPTDLVTRQ